MYVSLSRFYKKKLDIKAKKIRQILIKRYLGISNFIAGRRTQKLENATDAFCEYTVKNERFFVPFIFFGNRKVAKKVGRITHWSKSLKFDPNFPLSFLT